MFHRKAAKIALFNFALFAFLLYKFIFKNNFYLKGTCNTCTVGYTLNNNTCTSNCAAE